MIVKRFGILEFVVQLMGLSIAGCGSKTGLRDVNPVDIVPPPPPQCLPFRVQVPLGITAELRVELDSVIPELPPFMWSLVQGPTGATAQVVTTGNDRATFAPDAPGVYRINAAVPFTATDAGVLECEFKVEATVPDPSCPPEPIITPRVASIPGSPVRFAFDPAFGVTRTAVSTDSSIGMLAADDPTTDVAALIMDVPASGSLEAFGQGVESRIQSVLGAVPVLVGASGTTPDNLRMRRSLFRLATNLEARADVARDRVALELTQTVPGLPREGFTFARAFTVEITTVLRTSTGRGTVIFVIAPESKYEDARLQTGIRFRDIANGTGLVHNEQSLRLGCTRLSSTRTLAADFLWLVDTSSSMNDDQERLGNTAERFFREMNAAGIDFRVGVIQAGGIGPVNLDNPGFEWISGNDPLGPQRIAFEVTHQRYRDNPMDRSSPYPLLGQAEEPVASGVLVATEMQRRAMTDINDRRRFRTNATRVFFFASDERGTNDDMRFFAQSPAMWGATPEQRVLRAAQWYRERGYLTFGLADVFDTAQCPAVQNFVPCLTTLNDGAYIPLSTATDAEIAPAFSRIVDTIAGTGSDFVLPITPVSSTLRVRTENVSVPRSRAEGFDCDSTGRILVFRGASFLPRPGQTVRTAFFTWQ